MWRAAALSPGVRMGSYISVDLLIGSGAHFMPIVPGLTALYIRHEGVEIPDNDRIIGFVEQFGRQMHSLLPR